MPFLSRTVYAIIGTDAILGEGVIVKRSMSHTDIALVVKH